MGAGDSLGKRSGLSHQRTQILPHQPIKLGGGNIACGATGGAMRDAAARLAVTKIVEVPSIGRSRCTGQAAAPATDQRAQQILVCGVVSVSKRTVRCQLDLDLVKMR